MSDLDNFLRFIRPEGGWIEAQALDVPDGKWRANHGVCATADTLPSRLAEMEKRGAVGQYIVVNSLRDGVETRHTPEVWRVLKKDESVTDKDIDHRDALPIDCDCDRPSGIASTDAQLADAMSLADDVDDLLQSVGAPVDAIGRGCSGNGANVYLALDGVPANDEGTTADILHALAILLRRDGAKVDASTSDPKRLMPAPGTTKRKGARNVAARPHRAVTFMCADSVARVSFGELKAIRDALVARMTDEQRAQWNKATRKPAPKAPTSKPTDTSDVFALAKAVDISAVLAWLGIDSKAPKCPGCGSCDSGVAVHKNGLKCSHDRCADKGYGKGFRTTIDLVTEVRDVKPIEAVRLLGAQFGFDVPEPAKKQRKAKPAVDASGHHPTDLGNAKRFVQQHAGSVRWTADLGRLVYDGRKWERDRTGAWSRLGVQTVLSIYDEARACPDYEERKELGKWATESESAGRIGAMTRLAETFEGVAIRTDALDADPMLLNLQNGTLDLRTVALRPHDRRDLITRIANVTFDPDAKCPTFDRFLSRVLGGDDALIAFVQRFMGYALTADVREQVLLFCYGAGANGKSTFIDLMIHMLGSLAGYAMPGAPGLLLAKKHEDHPTALADLRGARLVTCVEVGDGKRFDEERVKALTGGDAIKARFMREDFFTFSPTFKLLLAANHKPTVRGTDHAIWRRILMVPFTVTISEAEKDPALPQKLRAELPGVLAWAVRGCVEWQRSGLRPPAVVTDATKAYRDEQDTLGKWIADECTVLAGVSGKASALYAGYRKWCAENGESEVTQTRFGLALGERGFTSERSKHGVFWLGISLRASDRDEPVNGGEGLSGSAARKRGNAVQPGKGFTTLHNPSPEDAGAYGPEAAE